VPVRHAEEEAVCRVLRELQFDPKRVSAVHFEVGTAKTNVRFMNIKKKTARASRQWL
jgi:hypothetical protein